MRQSKHQVYHPIHHISQPIGKRQRTQMLTLCRRPADKASIVRNSRVEVNWGKLYMFCIVSWFVRRRICSTEKMRGMMQSTRNRGKRRKRDGRLTNSNGIGYIFHLDYISQQKVIILLFLIVENNSRRIEHSDASFDLDCLHFFRVPSFRSDSADLEKSYGSDTFMTLNAKQYLRAFQRVDQTAFANVRIPDNADGNASRALLVALQKVQESGRCT